MRLLSVFGACSRRASSISGEHPGLYQKAANRDADTPYGVNYERVSQQITPFVVKPVRAVRRSDTALYRAEVGLGPTVL